MVESSQVERKREEEATMTGYRNESGANRDAFTCEVTAAAAHLVAS